MYPTDYFGQLERKSHTFKYSSIREATGGGDGNGEDRGDGGNRVGDGQPTEVRNNPRGDGPPPLGDQRQQADPTDQKADLATVIAKIQLVDNILLHLDEKLTMLGATVKELTTSLEFSQSSSNSESLV